MMTIRQYFNLPLFPEEEAIREEGKRDGILEGERKKAREALKNAQKLGIPLETVAQLLNLSLIEAFAILNPPIFPEELAAREEGVREGKREQAREALQNAQAAGVPFENAAKMLNLTIDEALALLNPPAQAS